MNAGKLNGREFYQAEYFIEYFNYLWHLNERYFRVKLLSWTLYNFILIMERELVSVSN